MRTERTELAWAAGFFDGEGWSSARRSGKRVRLLLGVNQNGRETLDRFWRAVGGLGRINGPYDTPAGKRVVWHYNAGGERSAQIVASALWPYLSQPKRAQFAEASAEWETYKQKRTVI